MAANCDCTYFGQIRIPGKIRASLGRVPYGFILYSAAVVDGKPIRGGKAA